MRRLRLLPSVVCLLLGFIVAVERSAVALPPDFFRIGRSRPTITSSPRSWKRSHDVLFPADDDDDASVAARDDGEGGFDYREDIADVVCGYCGAYYGPELETDCNGDERGSARETCMAKFVSAVRKVLTRL